MCENQCSAQTVSTVNWYVNMQTIDKVQCTNQCRYAASPKSNARYSEHEPICDRHFNLLFYTDD